MQHKPVSVSLIILPGPMSGLARFVLHVTLDLAPSVDEMTSNRDTFSWHDSKLAVCLRFIFC